MAASMDHSDIFGNDALFDEFERPAAAENDWDDDMTAENKEDKVKVTLDFNTGQKHTRFDDSSDSERETEDTEENPSIKIGPNSLPSTDKGLLNGENNDVKLNDDNCVLQVSFLNSEFARKHKDKIETFLANCIAEDEPCQYQMTEKQEYVECFKFYTDFMTDHKGSMQEVTELNVVNEDTRPVYDQVYKKSLPCIPDESDDEDACPQRQAGKKKNTCWNCDGDHSLSECPEPRNQTKINKNRNVFMAEKAGGQNNNKSLTESRYHIEDDLRFQNIKPGIISDTLRDALGLRNTDLPSYIYKMRQHGYPPGYLQEASLVESDISMFDKHGVEVNKGGTSMEDGEVDEQASKGGYNLGKIHEYAGFNVEINKDFKDYHQPPMNEFQLKSNLPKIFGEDVFRTIDGLQRDFKKENITDREDQDMELDTDCSPARPLRSSSTSAGTTSSEEISQNSVSLEDLEKQKQELLKNLNEDTETTETSDTAAETSEVESGEIEPDVKDSFITPIVVRSRSVLVNLGTPIGVNSEKDLPDSDVFRQNITEHIPYENLPNATGMFTKMMNVIGKVRHILKPDK